MSVTATFAIIAIGVMNFKPIMKYEFAIDAMRFIAVHAMKWISATTVEKLCVELVPHYFHASFADADFVKNAPPLVEGMLRDCKHWKQIVSWSL